MKTHYPLRGALALAALFFSTVVAFGQLFTGSNGRIAVTTDGNIHDEDDFGATPVTLAILAKAGLQDKLVHYDYSNHIGESTARGEREMTASTLGAQSRFGFAREVFFDDIKDLPGAINNLRSEINKSSANNRLFVVLGGPVEVLWRAINAAQPNKRQFVTVISHSFFNEFHANDNHVGQPDHGRPFHLELTHTIRDVQALGVAFRRIANQNDFWNTHAGNRGGFGALGWMEIHPDARMRWVYTRVQAVGRADYSDAGMMYFLITGNERADVNVQRNFFAGAFPPAPSTGGGGTSGGPQVGQTISLRGNNGDFVSSEDARRPMNCNRGSAQGWEKFTLVDAGGGQVALRNNNRFVSSENGNGPINCNRDAIGPWERFTITVTGSQQITIKGTNNRYISSENGSKAMTCNRTTARGWETFTWRVE